MKKNGGGTCACAESAATTATAINSDWKILRSIAASYKGDTGERQKAKGRRQKLCIGLLTVSAVPWSRDEVELIVSDYFAMLGKELTGMAYSKAEHNRRLRPRLRNRSKSSVEFKHQNITAVLLSFNLPAIDGYKPASNYQRLLEQVVLEHLSLEPNFFKEVADSPIIRPKAPPATDFSAPLDLVEEAPEPRIKTGQVVEPGSRVRKVDFVQRDAANRRLGELGEAWAIEFEERRLIDVVKRPDLARRIIWASKREGDGLGFDIRSFEADGSPRLIEVKTTGLTKYFPFTVSANEVAVSEREANRYHLYRVFKFSTDARLYMLNGALSKVCRLRPTHFEARL
jgi:hypothetical protein